MAYESKQAAPTDSLCARPLQRTAAHILVICAFLLFVHSGVESKLSLFTKKGTEIK